MADIVADTANVSAAPEPAKAPRAARRARAERATCAVCGRGRAKVLLPDGRKVHAGCAPTRDMLESEATHHRHDYQADPRACRCGSPNPNYMQVTHEGPVTLVSEPFVPTNGDEDAPENHAEIPVLGEGGVELPSFGTTEPGW